MEMRVDTIDYPAQYTTAPAPAPVRALAEKPWYHSKGTVGAIVAVMALGLGMAGYHIVPEMQAEIVEAWLDVVALGGAVIALVGRMVASKKLS